MDQYDIIAVILGVIFTLRKLDTQSRKPEQFPNVTSEDFLRWQQKTVKAYTPGAYASFFRVIFHLGFMRYVAVHPLTPRAFARVALLVDLVWLIATVSTLFRAHRARGLRDKLGIRLERPEPMR